MRKRKVQKKVDFLITISIYSLLFLIGVSVGSNELIVNNLGKIGFNAFVLTIGAVAGTILFSFIIGKKFFSDNKNTNVND